ncbi:MAG: hypothetical protein OEY52_02875 [Gammaproteobacteria bacterium]|nr:hypothetical protein [Gammaproteobacteria bacterium]
MKTTQIHVVKSLIYTIVVSLLVGVVAFKSSKAYYRHETFKSELANATITLDALNHLKLGNTKKAISVLETGLLGHVAVMDVSSKGISDKTYKSMQSKLREIKLYQASIKDKK